MANKESSGARELESYVDTGKEKIIQITLSGTPGTVTTVTLPDDAKGIKMFSDQAQYQFAVNRTVATLATSSSQTIAANDFSIGGSGYKDIQEIRLLPSGKNRTLTLLSTTASNVIDLEVF